MKYQPARLSHKPKATSYPDYIKKIWSVILESSPVARSQSIWLSNFISYHVNKSQIKEIEILLSVLKVISILMPQTDPGVDIEAGSQSSILKWEFLFLEITLKSQIL